MEFSYDHQKKLFPQPTTYNLNMNVPLQDAERKKCDREPNTRFIDEFLRAAPLHERRAASAERRREARRAMLKKDEEREDDADDDLERNEHRCRAMIGTMPRKRNGFQRRPNASARPDCRFSSTTP